jgi:hypothetical protein
MLGTTLASWWLVGRVNVFTVWLRITVDGDIGSGGFLAEQVCAHIISACRLLGCRWPPCDVSGSRFSEATIVRILRTFRPALECGFLLLLRPAAVCF